MAYVYELTFIPYNIKYIKITNGTDYMYWPIKIKIPESWYPDPFRYTPPCQKNKKWWIHPTTKNLKLSFADLSEIGYVLRKDHTEEDRKIKQESRTGRSGNKWFNDGNSNRKFFPDKIPEGWSPGRVNYKMINKRKSGSTTGKCAYNNGEINIYLKSDSIIPEGFVKGLYRPRKSI